MILLEFDAIFPAFFVNLLLQGHHVSIYQPKLICCSLLLSSEKFSDLNSSSIVASVSFELFKWVFLLS